MKISDKLEDFKTQGKTYYSFEFFPPKTDFGLDNLYSRIDRMASLQPAYIDITWGAGGSTADRTLEMSKTIQKYFGLEVMMHLTCTNMPVSSINKVLVDVQENGLSNILALRGDPPEGNVEWEKHEQGFKYGIDLVRFIRKEFGDDFFLGVGGYPDSHQEQSDIDLDISYLKEKVDAGSDIVVTQLFYDVDKFLVFRDKCSTIGIHVPIIPGIMPIHNYARFIKFTQFCKISIPNSVTKTNFEKNMITVNINNEKTNIPSFMVKKKFENIDTKSIYCALKFIGKFLEKNIFVITSISAIESSHFSITSN